MDEVLRSYEEVAYPCDPIYQTHPDSLATPAFLAGLSPPPVDDCRVLEIGCGTGGNLLPMALTLPKSRFIGVDLSPSQVAEGKKFVDELGLTNLELRAADIREIRDLGEVDYILCHGVYSWCPKEVQERILTLCQEILSPEGVAYISYNVLPGWHHVGTWRDLIRWGGRRGGDWRTRLRSGMRFLELAGKASESLDLGYSQLVAAGLDKLRPLPEAYLFHEFLESINEPQHFHEMVTKVGERGLQYLGESCRQTDLGALPPPVAEWLRREARDRVELEQCLDLIRNSSFRSSVFCRGGRALAEPSPERLASLYMNVLCEPADPEPSVNSEKEITFIAEKGQLSTDIPLIKAILVSLWRAWPRTFTLDELNHEVRLALEAVDDPELSDEMIAEAALHCYQSNLLALHVWAPKFSSAPGEKPLASPLARLQARHGAAQVTNLRHRNITLNPFELALLKKLDGTRDRAALLDEMVREGEAGGFILEKDGQRVREGLGPLIAESLPATLSRLAHGAFFIS